jgi:hypothetical protein
MMELIKAINHASYSEQNTTISSMLFKGGSQCATLTIPIEIVASAKGSPMIRAMLKRAGSL